MVQKSRRIIRVAFELPDERWTGGVNYLRNLLFAIASLDDGVIEPVVFVGNHLDEAVLAPFRGLARIEVSALFNRRNLAWKLRRAVNRIVGQDLFFRRKLVSSGVEVASHCNLTGRWRPYRVINWIPDFQHLRLPEFFPPAENHKRNWKYRKWIEDGDATILSSNAALADFQSFAPEHLDKARVLHFVSQADPRIYALDDCSDIRRKFQLPDKFFYLPNQFWEHKNHLTAVNALGLLKSRGAEIHLVCSGSLEDLKNSGYITRLKNRVEELGVADNFHVLGLIDYNDVLALFRHSVSVINPSLFEGWSSTVEEAKSVGKNIILSDIPVHREQDPPEAAFFCPDSHEELAKIMLDRWNERTGGPDLDLERYARASLPNRTRRFGEEFQSLVLEVLGGGRQ